MKERERIIYNIHIIVPILFQLKNVFMHFKIINHRMLLHLFENDVIYFYFTMVYFCIIFFLVF